MKESEWVTLHDICEEYSIRMNTESGRKEMSPVYFSGMKTLIQGALSMVEYFEKMHQNNRVYIGNQTDGFLFNLRTGQMRMEKEESFEEVPKDGFAVEKDGIEVIDINEFAAPELLMERKEKPDEVKLHFSVETDRYFLSVFLFEYFFHTGSPFEGKMMVNRCFLSPLEKEEFRAERGRFCKGEEEEENCPVVGIQDKLIRYWEEYPKGLQMLFRKAFMDAGTNTQLRPTEVDWKQILVRMTMDYKECSCGFHGFTGKLEKNDNHMNLCPKCGKVYYRLTNGMDQILLAEGEKLYECQTGRNPFDKDTVTGIVVENKQHKGLYGIKNISDGIWKGRFPNGTLKEIPRGQGIPIWNGIEIRFEVGEEWFLR